MFLSKPCFPVSFSKEELDGLVKETLGGKHWRDFKTVSTTLLFEPYYFFSYDVFFEKKQEETGALIVSDTQAGTMALNAVSGEFDEELSALAEESEPEILKDSPVPEGVEAEVERVGLSEQEVKRIAPMRLAAKLEVSKTNVEISGIKLAFVPFWRAEVEIGGKTFELVVNAVNGEVASEEEIPYREKSLLELTGETLSELKSPNAWVDYSSRIYHRIVGSKIMQSIGRAVLTNRYVQVAIVVIILAIIFWPRIGVK